MKLNITETLADPSIESKIELLTYLIERVKENQSNKLLESEIHKFIKAKQKPGHSIYKIITADHGLACLVAQFSYDILQIDDYADQARSLEWLVKHVKGFQLSSNELIKKTTVEKLIGILKPWEMELAFTGRHDKRLNIYLVPHEHGEANAYYYPWFNSIGLFKPRIGIYTATAEFIFFHEIGHLLAYWITGDPQKVPASFAELSSKLRPGSQADLVENFADLFTVAVMMDTKVAAKHPVLPALKAHEQKQIKDYFKQLVRDKVNIGHYMMTRV